MSITLIIIIVTCIVSFTAFSNGKVYDDLIFYPPAVTYNKQWYRFFSCGLIHADWGHLIFNMITLYFFGRTLEVAFAEVFGQMGKIFYLLLYISSLFFCLIPTYAKHRNDSNYSSLGASGAVSAVLFASILYSPTQGIGMFFIPIYIPGFIFAVLYLIVSSWMDKRGGDNINHSAHIWGALYGLAFFIVMAFAFSSYPLLKLFLAQIENWKNSF